jgi:hypothetical protein
MACGSAGTHGERSGSRQGNGRPGGEVAVEADAVWPEAGKVFVREGDVSVAVDWCWCRLSRLGKKALR